MYKVLYRKLTYKMANLRNRQVEPWLNGINSHALYNVLK